MDRRFATILAVIVLIFIGIFVVNKNSNNSNSSSNTTKAQPTNHVEGNNTKHVTLVEYGDYQCPICEVYYQPLKQVADQFNDQIAFQFRNLPLSSIHQNAFAAARAAEAAGLQGKYWQMHDKLYENQSDWDTANNPLSTFVEYASELGLNTTQFRTDYNSDKVNNAINADAAAFNKTGQQMATPTFFLDGEYVANSKVVDAQTGRPSVDKFAALINAEIAKKNPGNNQ